MTTHPIVDHRLSGGAGGRGGHSLFPCQPRQIEVKEEMVLVAGGSKLPSRKLRTPKVVAPCEATL